MESLEDTCTEYVSAVLAEMDADALLCIVKLAEHLGLRKLFDTAACLMVEFDWSHKQSISELVLFLQSVDKGFLQKVLHNPKRLALSELEVLEILEDTGFDEKDIADLVNVDIMHPLELKVLMEILLNKEHDGQTLLMRKVMAKHASGIVAEAFEDKSGNKTRFISDVMLPTSGINSIFDIPHSKLQLGVEKVLDTGKLCLYMNKHNKHR